jgi:hypothetical protein
MMSVEQSVECELAGETKYSEKTGPRTTLSTINPTRSDLCSDSSPRGGKPTTDRLSYGTANSGHFLKHNIT